MITFSQIMNDIAILTPQQFAQIRTLSRIQPKYIIPEESAQANDVEPKKKQIKKPKPQQQKEKNDQNKQSKPTRISALPQKSKSALACKTNPQVTIPKSKTKKPPIDTGNKIIQKKSRILPPSIVNKRNKNNKLSKIPFRQTPSKSRLESNESKEDIKNSNSFSSFDDENQSLKATLNQFTIKRIASPFDFTEEDNTDDSFSKTRSKIIKLHREFESLKTKRKKELDDYQASAINRMQNSKYFGSKNHIKSDSESLLELQNNLKKIDDSEFPYSYHESDDD